MQTALDANDKHKIQSLCFFRKKKSDEQAFFLCSNRGSQSNKNLSMVTWIKRIEVSMGEWKLLNLMTEHGTDDHKTSARGALQLNGLSHSHSWLCWIPNQSTMRSPNKLKSQIEARTWHEKGFFLGHLSTSKAFSSKIFSESLTKFLMRSWFNFRAKEIGKRFSHFTSQ